MKGRAIRLAAGTAAMCMVLGASPAFAQSATENLLLKLKEKGILSDDEYNALLAREQAQEAQQAQAAAPATTTVATSAPQQPDQAAAAALDDKRVVHMTENGIGLTAGGVTIKFSGEVNGFYVHDAAQRPGPNTTVAGGLVSVGDQSSSVRNGLLPAFFKTDVTTVQSGWDIGAHFGFYPGIESQSGAGGANGGGNPAALATAGIDFRQVYLTFGKPKFGEVKIGRDIGLFGADAILNDITILGSGSPLANSAPTNTTLGRIGIGYIYTDFQPQITYTTPKFGGFQASAGIFQPLTTAGFAETNSTPGFQGKITYDFKSGGLTGHLWASGIVQHHDLTAGLPAAYTGRAFDVGAKLGISNFGLVGYYYNGTGVGTTGLFILSADALGRTRNSDGFYGQATYTLGKLTVGGSYGESRLSLTNGEINPTLLDKNFSWVGQARYSLTSWMTLVGEYIHTGANAQGGNRARSDAVAVGGILFF